MSMSQKKAIAVRKMLRTRRKNKKLKTRQAREGTSIPLDAVGERPKRKGRPGRKAVNPREQIALELIRAALALLQ